MARHAVEQGPEEPRKGPGSPGGGLVVRMPSIGGAENGAYFAYPPERQDSTQAITLVTKRFPEQRIRDAHVFE
jgi:hypothetical protein